MSHTAYAFKSKMLTVASFFASYNSFQLVLTFQPTAMLIAEQGIKYLAGCCTFFRRA